MSNPDKPKFGDLIENGEVEKPKERVPLPVTESNPGVLVWRPFPGPQERFHQNSAFECLFGGAKGPGKTESLLREALRQVHLPRYRAILFRRTYPQLGEIIDRSFKYFTLMNPKPTYSDKDLQLKLPAWTFASGAKIAFGAVQHETDKYNYQGKEFQFQGFDQLEQFTESQYLYLIAQNRTSDPKIKRYVRASANPGGVGHGWVKRRFIEPLTDPNDRKKIITKWFKRVNDDDVVVPPTDQNGLSRSFVFSTLHDNPMLGQDYIATLRQLSDAEQRAFIDGDWEVFKGQFFNMWRHSVHVRNLPINPDFRKFISLDYGYGAPSCAIWWQVDFDGNLHAYRELYREGMTYEILAHTIREMTPSNESIDYLVADPAIWGDKSHHKSVKGESGAETIQNVFRSWCSVIKGDNERLTGWGRMRILFTPGPSGEPRMTYSPNCKNAVRTIPTLVHDETKVEDLDSDGEDHAADSSRYGVMSRPYASDSLPEPIPNYGSLEWFDKQLQFEKSMLEKSKGASIW